MKASEDKRMPNEWEGPLNNAMWNQAVEERPSAFVNLTACSYIPLEKATLWLR